jgi:hypothetical protein
MSDHSFEGESFMSDHDLESEPGSFGVLARHQLGRGNLGYFGPSSKREASFSDDFANLEYRKPATLESYCMDDRNEGYGIQLPGNRAISEIAAIYMDGSALALPLSTVARLKVRELVALGNKPVFHGDEATGKKGCAANLNLRTALVYGAENSRLIANMARDRLRLLGIDTVRQEDLRRMIEVGGARAADESLWDITAEEVIDVARLEGAGYVEYPGPHRTPGIREDMSAYTFDNGAFRASHKTDDGHPAGVLSVTPGAYLQQLMESGYSEEVIVRYLSGVEIFTVEILKLATNEEIQDVLVGEGVIN